MHCFESEHGVLSAADLSTVGISRVPVKGMGSFSFVFLVLREYDLGFQMDRGN